MYFYQNIVLDTSLVFLSYQATIINNVPRMILQPKESSIISNIQIVF